MKQLSLGDRMKKYYEKPYNIKLPNRIPIILRLDGKNFHTLTKNMKKPFDNMFINMMQLTALYLCKNIDGAQLAYIQSDEISILIHNYKKLETQSWFDNKIQKIVSVSAGMASAYFSKLMPEDIVVFDARVFVLPEADVVNYFIWRQQDWQRNSIQMIARSLFSHKECLNKNKKELNKMCLSKGKNWNNLKQYLKVGSCIYKPDINKNHWLIDKNIPEFVENRNYIEKLLEVEEK